jgi:hypothetical protein
MCIVIRDWGEHLTKNSPVPSSQRTPQDDRRCNYLNRLKSLGMRPRRSSTSARKDWLIVSFNMTWTMRDSLCLMRATYFLTRLTLWPSWWRHYVLPERRRTLRNYGVTSKKTTLFKNVCPKVSTQIGLLSHRQMERTDLRKILQGLPT